MDGAMRCPDCQKFVPYDTDQEPDEDEAPSLEADGQFMATYTRRLACAECGTDLKEAVIEVEGVLECSTPCRGADGGGHEWTLVDCGAYPTIERRGYGVGCVVTAECARCGVKHEQEFEASMSAGFFEEVA
jgi:hypothetical protein